MKLIEIHIVMDDREIRVSLGEFKKLLKQEIGAVWSMFSQKTFEQRFDTACARIMQRIRDGL